ncbi:putative N-acetyltransferase camello [Glandiceps talaboti]
MLKYRTQTGEFILRSFRDTDTQEVKTLYWAVNFEYLFDLFKNQLYYFRVWASILTGMVLSWWLWASPYVTTFVAMVMTLGVYLSCIVEKRRQMSIRFQTDLKDIKKYYIDNPRNHFWVAEHNGKVVGIVGIQEDHVDSTKAELLSLGVEQEYRKLGLGSKLMDIVEDFATQNGYRELWLETVPMLKSAMKLYDKKQYRLVKMKSINMLFGRLEVLYYSKILKRPKKTEKLTSHYL